MPDQSPEMNMNISISDDDLQVALRLLNEEESDKRADQRAPWLNVVFYASFAIGLASWILGFIAVLTVDYGWVFLLIALVMTIIFFKSSDGDFNTKAGEIRKSILSTDLGKAMVADWDSRTDNSDVLLGCSVFLFIPIILIGIGWFALDAILGGYINFYSVAMIYLPPLIIFIFTAKDAEKEFHYLTRVNQLQTRLQNVKVASDDGASLSIEEYQLLSHIENQQVDREIANAVPEFPQHMQEAYSVTIFPKAQNFLGSLTIEEFELRLSIREAIDDLQNIPYPPNASPIDDSNFEFLIMTQDFEINYQVDVEHERINVTDINIIPREEANDAS